MTLYTLCKGCEHEISIKPTELTRPDLERAVGEYFRSSCPNCAKNQETHVNNVMAKPTSTVVIGAGIFGGALALGFMFVFGWISLGLFLIPILIWKQQDIAAQNFNRYRVKKTER